MDKALFAIIAAAGAAFAALAPAGANSFDPGAEKPDSAVRVSWRTESVASACRIEMHWKRDYSGQPYLKKVRICA